VFAHPKPLTKFGWLTVCIFFGDTETKSFAGGFVAASIPSAWFGARAKAAKGAGGGFAVGGDLDGCCGTASIQPTLEAFGTVCIGFDDTDIIFGGAFAIFEADFVCFAPVASRRHALFAD
jgi:hypothetical protein